MLHLYSTSANMSPILKMVRLGKPSRIFKTVDDLLLVKPCIQTTLFANVIIDVSVTKPSCTVCGVLVPTTVDQKCHASVYCSLIKSSRYRGKAYCRCFFLSHQSVLETKQLVSELDSL